VVSSMFKNFSKIYNTVIAVNLRGIGSSTGSSTITGWDEREDIIETCKYALSIESKNPPKNIYIIGKHKNKLF
jgi:alpha/beta superfamily hydrolase